MIPIPAASQDKRHELIEEDEEGQTDGDDLIHNGDSTFNIESQKRKSPLRNRNLKEGFKKKLIRYFKIYKSKRSCWVITFLAILIIFLIWYFFFSITPRIKYKLPDYRQKEKPVIRKTFTNPTQFVTLDDIKIESTDQIPMLEISVNVYDVDHLNIVIRDSNNVRYEVPFEHPYPHGSYNRKHFSLEESLFDLKLDWENFNIQVIRRETEEVLFSFKDRFVYSDLYIEFSFDLPTREVYGIGERLTSLQLKSGYYTIFVINRSGFIDTGEQGLNQEGHHPMYLVKERSGKYHINLIRNLSPQEAILRNDTRMKWKFTGGVIDFNFFLGNDPEKVIEKYHRYCGGWAKPAIWHLGAHLNKWFGYKTVDELEWVLAQHKRLQIPLDALWSDIDVYKSNWNFVPHVERYPKDKMNALFNKYQKKWIPVIDPYVNLDPVRDKKDLTPYNHPLLESIYLRDQKGRICDGIGFGNKILLLDFMNPDAQIYWKAALGSLDSFHPLGGVWADDNEVSVFKDSFVNAFRGSEFWYLPFYPGGKNFYELPLPNANCLHYGGVYEHDIRSVTSLYQSIYTFNFLNESSPFPFVLSRATMFGGAQYAYHWIPDTFSDWPTLRASIGTILTFQIFGYSMVGSDVCGFIGNNRTDGELCARWYQSAVFYPFHRNSHQPTNELNNWQEPYMYIDEYYQGIMSSLYLKYSLLRHFYKLFFETKIGEEGKRGYGMVLKPLFIEFGREEGFPPYGDLKNEEEFMVGNSLLVAPALYPNVTEVEVYFPSGIRWYDVRKFQEVFPDENSVSNISALVGEEPPYFLRGGHMIIKQDMKGVYSTADLGNHIHLIAGLDTINKGKGKGKEETLAYKLMLISNTSDEYNIYNSCVLGECMVTLELIISQTSNEETKITLKTADVANISDEYVYLDALYIMGLDLNKRSLKSSSQGTGSDTSSSNSITWESSYEDKNNSTVKISFAEPLRITKSSHFTISV